MNQTEIYSWGQLSQQRSEWTRRRWVERERGRGREQWKGSFIITVAPRLTELKVVSCRGEKRRLLLKNSKYITHNTLCNNIQRSLVQPRDHVRSVFISWLLPCCLSAPPLATGWRLGDVRLRGRAASRSSSLLLLSSLPDALAESEELLLPVLLICSIMSTSARNSASSDTHFQSLFVCVEKRTKATHEGRNWMWSSGCFLELLTSLDVIELRLGGGIVLWRWRGFYADPRLDGGSEQWAGLVGANWLLLDPGLDLAAALSPKTQKMIHPESSES